MPLSDAYATPQLYRAVIHKLDERVDDDIQGDLLAVSRYMEHRLHTFFNKDDTLKTRYFTPAFKIVGGSSNGAGWAESENPWMHLRGYPYLQIDPIADVTGLVITVDTDRDGDFADETALVSADYVLLPRNALVGPEPLPYTYIQQRNDFHWQPYSEVKIDAIWGWPAVPKAVERACCHLTALLRIETPRATTITQMEQSIGASKECQAILDNLMSAYKVQLPI